MMEIESYIEKKDVKFSETIQLVHDLIIGIHPQISLQNKYGIPMYVLRKNLFYLDVQKNQLILGIVYAKFISSIEPLLDFTGRKQIGHFSLMEFDQSRYEELQFILNEAVNFDLNRNK